MQSIAEYFDELQGEWLSATPWPWPQSLSEDELDFFRQVWPDQSITGGVVLADRIEIHANRLGVATIFSVDLNSLTLGPARETL
jgi:hypothetical protein